MCFEYSHSIPSLWHFFHVFFPARDPLASKFFLVTFLHKNLKSFVGRILYPCNFHSKIHYIPDIFHGNICSLQGLVHCDPTSQYPLFWYLKKHQSSFSHFDCNLFNCLTYCKATCLNSSGKWTQLEEFF